MITIASATTLQHALDRPPDEHAGRILARYEPTMGDQPLATIFVIQPGDTQVLLAGARGNPFASWEFINFETGWFEAVFVLSDDGYGHVVLVPDDPGIDTTLLSACRENAGVMT